MGDRREHYESAPRVILHRSRATAAGLVLACTAAGAGARQTYRYIEIPVPAGALSSQALGVNNAGDVVGVFVMPGNQKTGFLYEHDTGVLNTIPSLGTSAAGREIGAYSVNDHREVVGIYAPSGLPRAFYWSPTDGLRNITYAPPVNNNILAEAWGIGNNGDIAGVNTAQCASSPTFGVDAAAIWTSLDDPPQAPISTPFPCAVGGMLMNINDRGDAAGIYAYSDGSAIWQRPLVVGPLGRRDLPTFSGLSEYGTAFSVNNLGYACGSAENRSSSGPPTGPCFWDAGSAIHRLQSIPAANIFGEARSINDALDVVGWAGTNRVAVIWPQATSGPPIDLNTVSVGIPAGRSLTSAMEISQTGYIVGKCNETSSPRAFLLEPCTPVIARPPQDDEIDSGDSTEFEVVAGGSGVLTYQWRHDGQPLSDGVTVGGSIITGSHTATLEIDSAVPADEGAYDVVIVSSCGQVTSAAGMLTVIACPADFDRSGFVDTDDYTAFVAAFEAGGDDADFDGSGFVDTDDFTEFVLAFIDGC